MFGDRQDSTCVCPLGGKMKVRTFPAFLLEENLQCDAGNTGFTLDLSRIRLTPFVVF